MCATFNSNPWTTIVSDYSPTYTSDEFDISILYKWQSFLSRHIPKHNVQIIDGNINI